MKMQSLGTLAYGLSLGLSLALPGCGSSNPPAPASAAAASTTPTTLDGMSETERGKHCFIKGDQESEPARQAFLTELTGTWVHHPSDTSKGITRKEFRFDTTANIAAVTDYSDIGQNVDDMTFKKVCLSKPLDNTHGAYSGFRVLELLSSDGQGAAAVFVKIDPPTDATSQPKLTASDRYYIRFDSTTDPLQDIGEITSSGQISHFWTYRDKH